MSDSRPDINIKRNRYVDIYDALNSQGLSDVPVGTKLSIQNKGMFNIIKIITKASEPTSIDGGFDLYPGKSTIIESGESGVWIYSSVINTDINVKVLNEFKIKTYHYHMPLVGYVSDTTPTLMFTPPAGVYRIEWNGSTKSMLLWNYLICSGGWGDWFLNKGDPFSVGNWETMQSNITLNLDGTDCFIIDTAVENTAYLDITATLLADV